MNRSRKSESRRSARAAGRAAVAAAALTLPLASCAPDKMPFDAQETFSFAGGIEIDGRGMNQGYQSYMRYCYACHGEHGDGKGPSSAGLSPPPRDFTKGIFKFARLRSSDELPNDEDLIRIVKGGLHGTAMLPWDVPEIELVNVLQYIKSFSPKWTKKKKNGEPVKTLEPFAATEDPWRGNEAEAVLSGKELYHIRAECLNCHPGYDTKEALYKLSVEAANRDPDRFKALTGFRDDLYHPVAKDAPEYGVKVLPPDFTMNPVRSIRDDSKVSDLFRLIAYGVYPVMPAWRDAGLSDKDIWALAHYVKSLIELRATQAAIDFKERMVKQPDFQIPAAAVPVEGGVAAPEREKGAAADAAAEPGKRVEAAPQGDAKARDKKDVAAKTAPQDKNAAAPAAKPAAASPPAAR
jgi:mono/diheme cytochrome c family protein